MMGRLHWVGTCFAMHGQTSTSLQPDEIMSKYRPIAPKPTFHMTSNLCKSPSNSNSALDFHSTFTTTPKGNNNAKSGNGGHNRSGRRRRAYDCSEISSPRVLKRARAPNIDRTDKRITHNIVGSSLTVNGPEIVYPFDGSFREEKPSTIEKGLEAMEIAAPNSGKERSVLDISYGGFEGVNIKAVMKSSGEVGVEIPATNMEVVPVPRMQEETHYGCGCDKYFVFPIVSDIQQEEEKHLVTLPLLPRTPLLQKYYVFGSSASDSASPYHKPNIPNASCDQEEIALRIFGRDISHKEVGACQLGSSNESPKPRNFVPVVRPFIPLTGVL